METSVGSILSGAFGTLRRHPLAVLIWGALYLALIVVSMIAMRPAIEAQLRMQEQLLRGGGDLQSAESMQAIQAMQGMFGQMMLFQLLALAIMLALFAASMRAVLRPAESSFAFLRLGWDEARILGLTIFLIVAGYLAMIPVIFAIVLVIGVGAVVGGVGGAAGAMMLSMIALFGLIIWVEVRLSLALPLTLHRGQFVIAESWRLTRGRFWPLFGAYLILALIMFAIALPYIVISLGPYISMLAENGLTPETLSEAMRRQLEAGMELNAMTAVSAILGAVVGGIGIALFGGAVATAALDLTGEGAAGTFA